MTNARLLATNLAHLLRRERADLAEFLVALADFDRRRCWIELGYASLFYFLHRELGLSAGSAHYRKTAAVLIQRFPEIVEPLRDGRLCLTTIVQVAKVLTAENRHRVLPKFFQRSRRESMVVAATIQPATAATHRDVVTAARSTALPVAATAAAKSAVQPVEPAAERFGAPGSAGGSAQVAAVQPAEPAAGTMAAGIAPRPTKPAGPSSAGAESFRSTSSTAVPPAETDDEPLLREARRRDSADPLTADLSRLHVTVSKRFLAKLEAARIALSHSQPDAGMEAILEAGLDLLLQRHARRKGLVARPRKSPPASKPDSDSISAGVKREVWIRDSGCCQWPLQSGGICASTRRVEFDHIIPRAMGGPSTAPNVRLLCRLHNQIAARRVFGDAWMDRFGRNPAQVAGGPPGASG